MISYIIERDDSKLFYKHRQYTDNRWVTAPQKAKRYSRRGDAGNAITLMRAQMGLAAVTFNVLEYELSPTGKRYCYSPKVGA